MKSDKLSYVKDILNIESVLKLLCIHTSRKGEKQACKLQYVQYVHHVHHVQYVQYVQYVKYVQCVQFVQYVPNPD